MFLAVVLTRQRVQTGVNNTDPSGKESWSYLTKSLDAYWCAIGGFLVKADHHLLCLVYLEVVLHTPDDTLHDDLPVLTVEPLDFWNQ